MTDTHCDLRKCKSIAEFARFVRRVTRRASRIASDVVILSGGLERFKIIPQDFRARDTGGGRVNACLQSNALGNADVDSLPILDSTTVNALQEAELPTILGGIARQWAHARQRCRMYSSDCRRANGQRIACREKPALSGLHWERFFIGCGTAINELSKSLRLPPSSCAA